jgi:hypothetical protein
VSRCLPHCSLSPADAKREGGGRESTSKSHRQWARLQLPFSDRQGRAVHLTKGVGWGEERMMRERFVNWNPIRSLQFSFLEGDWLRLIDGREDTDTI